MAKIYVIFLSPVKVTLNRVLKFEVSFERMFTNTIRSLFFEGMCNLVFTHGSHSFLLVLHSVESGRKHI